MVAIWHPEAITWYTARHPILLGLATLARRSPHGAAKDLIFQPCAAHGDRSDPGSAQGPGRHGDVAAGSGLILLVI